MDWTVIETMSLIIESLTLVAKTIAPIIKLLTPVVGMVVLTTRLSVPIAKPTRSVTVWGRKVFL